MENTLTPKEKLKDILLDINVGKLATKYFNRSPSWLYHKFDRIDGNGGSDDFTEDELNTLKSALLDLAKRLVDSAQKL